jgi:hypothetical protein
MDPPYRRMQIFPSCDQLLDPADGRFMDAHQIRIEDTTPDFLLSRANDQLLIPLFHEKGIRDDHLHRLNLCRLFLQVLTISDITTGCGTKITKAAWKGYVTLRTSS